MQVSNVLVIPDSFKGTMRSLEVCDIIERQIHSALPDCHVRTIPVADGGEGTVDAFLAACGGQKISASVKGPYLEPLQASFGLLPDGTAVVEVAAAAGLPLVGARKNPSLTTSYGVGQLLQKALDHSPSRGLLALGGSCTNDGGCGLASALGVRFYDARGQVFLPTGGTLQDIQAIDMTGLDSRVLATPFVAMCDVTNPLCGPSGAAHVFAPQKGADAEMVELLDKGLLHLSGLLDSCGQDSILHLPGGGAAGGIGAAAHVFLHAQLQSGIQTLLDMVCFEELAKKADLILTGEGKFDSQSLGGKVIWGIATRAKAVGTPVIVLAGDIGDDIESAYDLGVTAVLSINRIAAEYPALIHRAPDDLAKTVDTLIRLLTLSQ